MRFSMLFLKRVFILIGLFGYAVHPVPISSHHSRSSLRTSLRRLAISKRNLCNHATCRMCATAFPTANKVVNVGCMTLFSKLLPRCCSAHDKQIFVGNLDPTLLIRYSNLLFWAVFWGSANKNAKKKTKKKEWFQRFLKCLKFLNFLSLVCY